MPLKFGFMKKEAKMDRNNGKQAQQALNKQQQTNSLKPIPLPDKALAEVLDFIPRGMRASLAMVNRQVSALVVNGINAERQKVSLNSPSSLPIRHSSPTESTFQLLATAPGICSEIYERLDVHFLQRKSLHDDWSILNDRCNDEMELLIANRPPLLLYCQFACRLSPEGEALVLEARLHEARLVNCQQRIEEKVNEILLLQSAVETRAHRADTDYGAVFEARVSQWRWVEKETSLQLLLLFQAELSLVFIEFCKLEVALRQLETRILRVGNVHFLSFAVSARYQAARDADPDFILWCDAHAQLAARHEQKRRLELHMLNHEKQVRPVVEKMLGIAVEYDRVGAEQKGAK